LNAARRLHGSENLALGCLKIVLDKGEREDWFESTFIVTLAAVSAVSFVLFFAWELARPDPIVDVRLLFQRQFGMAFLVMMSVGAILFSTTQLLPQLLQTSFQYTAMLSGLALMPGGLAMLLMMPIAGQLASRFPPKHMMVVGMVLIALAMWHMTSLFPDASFAFFAWARIYQMIGLPLLFIPITTASYAGLPQDKTNQASALINVARNLGGSFGVSLCNTLLAQRAQFHQARLVEHTSSSSLAFQDALRKATDYFVSQGASALDAQRQAMAWIGQLVASQATLLAYIDVFCGSAIFALAMIPLALLMRRINSGAQRQGATQ